MNHDNLHYGLDTVLHVVASSSSGGDGGADEPLMMSATVICSKAQHLLGARNARGDTPLHCAAMVSHLIDLARRQDDDGGASVLLQVVLRKENKRGETPSAGATQEWCECWWRRTTSWRVSRATASRPCTWPSCWSAKI
jgi:hypothetical protein